MLLGPHIKALKTPDQTREFVVSNGWGVFQTHWGSPQTLRLKDRIFIDYNNPKESDPIWVIHGCYVGVMTPKSHVVQATIDYLRKVTQQANQLGAKYVVMHVGGTKEKTAQEVEDGLRSFIEQSDICGFLELNTEVTVLVENVAAKYPFNKELMRLATLVQDYPRIGWCLDTAHSNAAAVEWESLQEIIDKYPPNVCHANFPGSAFGSGRDRHGWRGKVTEESPTTIGYEKIIKSLRDKNVPLILEGGSDPASTTMEELDYMKNLLERQDV